MADKYCDQIKEDITIEPKMDYENRETQVGWLFFTCYNYYRKCKGACPRQEHLIKDR